MTPINANLDKISLPTDADASTRHKMLLIGDSQGGHSVDRLGGWYNLWDLPWGGRLASLRDRQTADGAYWARVTMASVGAAPALTFTAGTGPQDTISPPADQWPSDDSTMGLKHGAAWVYGGDVANNENFFLRATLLGSVYPNNWIAAKALTARVLYRANGSTVSEIRARPIRNGTSTGLALPRALASTGGVDHFDVAIPLGFGTDADNCGFALLAGADVVESAGDTIEVLGYYLFETAAASNGFHLWDIGASGDTAQKHLNRLTDAEIDAMIEAADGYDSVMILLGHNTESTYAASMEALAEKWIARHLAAERDAPGILVVTPWARGTDGGNARMAAQNQAMYDLCVAQDWGFISLFEMYEGEIPAGEITTPRTTATYTLDAGSLHPDDAVTAQQFVEDIEWHWDPANWQQPTPNGRATRRERRSIRLRSGLK